MARAKPTARPHIAFVKALTAGYAVFLAQHGWPRQREETGRREQATPAACHVS
jgi:hypothetical protein